MSYLINPTYFIREYSVPNSTELTNSENTNLMYFIDEKVRLFMLSVLGQNLFDSLDSDIDQETGDLEISAAQRWKDFVNGATYTKNDKSYKWLGILRLEGSFKSSLLVPMVYNSWLSAQNPKQSGTGSVIVMSKNAIVVNPTAELVGAWNDFVNQYQGACGRHPNAYYHRGVPVTDWFGSGKGDIVSMSQFLRDNSETYPNAPLPSIGFKNRFGF